MRETKFRAYHKERKEMFEIASIDFEEKKGTKPLNEDGHKTKTKTHQECITPILADSKWL